MIHFKIKIEGLDDKILDNSKINNIINKYGKKIARNIISNIKKRFTKRVNPYPSVNIVSNIRDKIKVRFPRKIKFTRIGERSGDLKNSFYIKLNDGNSYKEFFINSRSPYAYIQENGGVIKSRTGKYMAIPLNKKAYLSKSVRDISDTVVYNKIVFKKINNRTYLPMFLYVDRVNIKGHKFVEYALNNFRKDYIYSMVEEIENIIFEGDE